MGTDILSDWSITAGELAEIVAENPSMRGLMFGFVAEYKLKKEWLLRPGIENLTRPRSHDRLRKCDFCFDYRGLAVKVEVKCLETAKVRVLGTNGYVGTFQCNATATGELRARPQATTKRPITTSEVTRMLFLSEEDVLALFPMEAALRCVEASFVAQHSGGAVNHPRRRIFLPHASLHYMAAALPSEDLLGLKIYTVSGGSSRFVVLLYEAEQGELLALIEADHLGRIRTGAASGVATQYLSRAEASTAGLIGAGRQARTQLQAVSLVRPLKAVRVFSRDEERQRYFCRIMSEQLHLQVEPAESAEAAARFGDVVISATTSRQPVLRGDWLKPGAHVNAIGANAHDRREVDDALLRRAAVIAVDSIEQAKIESGDLIQGFANSPVAWESVAELHEIIAGSRYGRRSSQDVTLFKSAGIALWDVAAAGAIYRRAGELGRGKELRIS